VHTHTKKEGGRVGGGERVVDEEGSPSVGAFDEGVYEGTYEVRV
jgi:hypothetical protein